MSEFIQMNREHPNLGALLDLALGTASDTDRGALLDHIGECADCEHTFRNIVADRERARADHGLELDASGLPILNRRRPSRVATPLRWAAVIPLAAAAVLAFVLIGSPPSHRDTRLALTTLPAPVDELRLRDADAVGDAELLAGLQAYISADFEAAVGHLQATADDDGEDLVRQVYLGSALAQTGRFADACVILERIDARTLPDPWGSEALWTLAVAYQRLRQPARADSLISSLAHIPGEVGDRARAALALRVDS